MASRQELILARLDAIARAAAQTGKALALIGVGSVGLERDRLDAFSDLDFFVVAKHGFKADLIRNTAWLSSAHAVSYLFQNTADGFKALFADEIYCEFAVFEADDLRSVPFAEGRIVWKEPGVSEALSKPPSVPALQPAHSTEWLLGEALSCLYVGLGRYWRGEKLSAFRFVQVFVIDRVLELASSLEAETPAFRDPFAAERRFEQRFPETARAFASFMQGYDATPQSALAILEFLDRHFEINQPMKQAIMRLCTPG